MRILKAKKSKYYDAALRDFERARRCYERAGLAAEWQRVVGEVRTDHRRKTSFLPRFEEVVNASGPSQEPAFSIGRRRAGPRRTGRTLEAAVDLDAVDLAADVSAAGRPIRA